MHKPDSLSDTLAAVQALPCRCCCGAVAVMPKGPEGVKPGSAVFVATKNPLDGVHSSDHGCWLTSPAYKDQPNHFPGTVTTPTGAKLEVECVMCALAEFLLWARSTGRITGNVYAGVAPALTKLDGIDWTAEDDDDCPNGGGK